MKKLFISALVIACLFGAASCRSASGATDALSASEKKERKEAAAFAAKQKTDPYTGWAYVPQKKVDISNGLVRLVLNGSTGTFCVYAKHDGSADVPVLSTVDSSVSTFFSVKIGRQIYKLSKEGGANCEARLTPYGAQMAYTVGTKAYVVVDFSFLPSSADSPLVDMVRVSVYCINIGRTLQTFGVKGVFDTYLGETTRAHFSTSNISTLNSETAFNNMETALWIRSRNENTAVQFLLHGREITEPEIVILSNKDNLSSSAWIPSVQENRSFSSVLSFENSAVGVNWPSVYLDPMKSDIITFYMSLSSDGTAPAGKEFLRELAQGRTALWNRPSANPLPDQLAEDGEESSSGVASSSNATSTSASLDDDGLSLYGGSSYEEPVKVPSSTMEKPESSKTKETNQLKTDPQLDPEYIQSLIDRIDELSQNPSLAKPGEIESLNKELDQILTKLRSRL